MPNIYDFKESSRYKLKPKYVQKSIMFISRILVSEVKNIIYMSLNSSSLLLAVEEMILKTFEISKISCLS